MIEQTILSGLAKSDEYARRVLPYLKEEYFDAKSQKIALKLISDYIEKYNGLPTEDALRISLDNKSGINEETEKEVSKIIDSLSFDPKTDVDWLLDTTEKWCQDKAVYNAVRDSILILDGEDKHRDKGAIPELLAEALGISFDSSLGHDYFEDAEERYEFYITDEERISFGLDLLDKITRGGVSRKTLNIIMAGTGVGKSLAMCHLAAMQVKMGYNVLYISMEMSEERIGERLDANLIDVPLDKLKDIPRDKYLEKVRKVQERSNGRLKLKEYPTSQAGASHFRFLLNEYKIKHNFVPDIVYIDYLNICSSSRIKMGANVNSYGYIKAIAEELRGLAVEFDVPIISATQTNRNGYGNTDVELTDTSESFGLPATADFMMALIASEELEELGQIMGKQLKNRYGDLNYYKRFVIGVDRPKMRLYDVDDQAQANLVDSGTQNVSGTKEKFNNFS